MKRDRRQIIQLLGIGGVVSLSGCINVPGEGTNETDTGDGSSDGGDDGSAGTTGSVSLDVSTASGEGSITLTIDSLSDNIEQARVAGDVSNAALSGDIGVEFASISSGDSVEIETGTADGLEDGESVSIRVSGSDIDEQDAFEYQYDYSENLDDVDRLVTQSEGVMDLIDYLRYEYTGDYIGYNENGIDPLLDYLEEVREKSFSEMKVSDLEEIKTKIDTVIDYRPTEYYETHYDWAGLKELVENMIRFLDRQEEELFFEEFDLLINRVSDQREGDLFSYWYPDENVWREPLYELFVNVDSESDDYYEGFLFECTHYDVTRDAFYVMPDGDMKIDTPPFNLSGISYNANGASASSDRTSDIFEDIEWLAFEDEADQHFVINIYDAKDNSDISYPEDYVESGHDEDDFDSTLVVDHLHPIGVSIQVFESEQMASTKMNELLDKGQTADDVSVDRFGVEYTHVFYIDEPESDDEDTVTYYADVKQVGEYIITIDPTTVPWSERMYYYGDPSDVGEDEDKEDVLDTPGFEDIAGSSFIDPEV